MELLGWGREISIFSQNFDTYCQIIFQKSCARSHFHIVKSIYLTSSSHNRQRNYNSLIY